MEVGIKVVEAVDAWWIPLLIAIDVIAAGLLVLWAFLVLKESEAELVLEGPNQEELNKQRELKLKNEKRTATLNKIEKLTLEIEKLKRELENLDD